MSEVSRYVDKPIDFSGPDLLKSFISEMIIVKMMTTTSTSWRHNNTSLYKDQYLLLFCQDFCRRLIQFMAHKTCS